MKIFHYIARFYALSKSEKKIIFIAIITSGIIRFLTFFFPIKFYVFLFKLKPSQVIQNKSSNENYKMVLKTINRISDNVPWESNCLVKALSSKILLYYFYGIETDVILRVTKSKSNEIFAHALVKQSNYQKEFIIDDYSEFIISSQRV